MPAHLPIAVWFALWAIALVVRVWGGIVLPNAEQDGYSDAEMVARLTAHWSAGQFHLADLYGFWLPLFQVAAAILNLALHDSLLSGKMVSSFCGAISCVLVFAIAFRLTKHALLSAAAFILVLINPLHLLYSAACMTDVPFGCLLLACLWFALEARWVGAYICLALAAGVRVEAWPLIPVLPVLQYLQQKRVSFPALIVPALPVLGWFCLSRIARGDWRAFFQDRVRYHAHYIDFHPTRKGFAMADVVRDLDYLFLGANKVVLLASVVVLVFLLVRWLRRRQLDWGVFATASFLFAVFGFLFAAYVTKRQPVFLPRYGLFAFVLGLPLLTWVLQFLMEWSVPSSLGKFGAIVVLLACAFVMRAEVPVIPKVMKDFRAHEKVARILESELGAGHDETRHCFSDDVAVRVLSRLPQERFARTGAAPFEAWDDRAVFEKYLRDERVAYLVVMPTEDSLPVKFYPELASDTPPADERFELITSAISSFGPDVWLYRMRD